MPITYIVVLQITKSKILVKLLSETIGLSPIAENRKQLTNENYSALGCMSGDYSF